MRRLHQPVALQLLLSFVWFWPSRSIEYIKKYKTQLRLPNSEEERRARNVSVTDNFCWLNALLWGQSVSFMTYFFGLYCIFHDLCSKSALLWMFQQPFHFVGRFFIRLLCNRQDYRAFTNCWFLKEVLSEFKRSFLWPIIQEGKKVLKDTFFCEETY